MRNELKNLKERSIVGKFNRRLIKLERIIGHNKRRGFSFEEIVSAIHYARVGNKKRLERFPPKLVKIVQEGIAKASSLDDMGEAKRSAQG